MSGLAAWLTAPGTGAIATIALAGDSAQAILRRVFHSSSRSAVAFEAGHILLGHITDGAETIDQVTIGCEGPDVFAIHCHGNPLIVEAIMKLLERHGVEPVSAEALFVRMLSWPEPPGVMALEAKLALTTVKTLEGARLIANQASAGLSQKAEQWRRQLESGSLDDLACQVRRVLHDSETAKLMIEGCTVALIGPAGAGKSTLLNTLAGREKAIVTGIKGTTRDWVSAEIHIPPLAVTVIDTAGLDADFSSAEGGIDEAAQARSMEVLNRADVVLFVLDISRPTTQLDETLLARLSAKKVVTVLNKADRPARLDATALPVPCHGRVCISAETGAGINELIAAVHRTCGVGNFDFRAPVAFTVRQRRLLERLLVTDSPGGATNLIDDLVSGPIQR